MKRLKDIQASVDVRTFWWAVGLSVVGCFLLVASLFIPPAGVIEASVISAAGLVFTFSGAIVGINGNFNTKLMKFEADVNQKINNTEQKKDDNISDTSNG